MNTSAPVTKRAFCPIINDSCKRDCVFRDSHASSKGCSVVQYFEDVHTITDKVQQSQISTKLDDIKEGLRYLQ